MRLFLVLYMVAEKSSKNLSYPFHSLLFWCKIVKKRECSAPLWSFNFLAKLMRAANCVWFCLNLFCRDVNEGQSI